MSENFNGAAEPMRAIRDLIVLFEAHVLFIDDQEFLDRARDGFHALRKLFGDNRPAEDIADAAMIEPRDLRTPLQLATGALRSMEHLSFVDPQRPIHFVGDWSHFGTWTISDILDKANEALEVA